MKSQQKTLTDRHDAYKDGMDKALARYSAALESLNATINATLQDAEIIGLTPVDCDAWRGSKIHEAADLLARMAEGTDKAMQSLSKIVHGERI
jgi:hypothetical protein